jgi:hypothetical protein
MYIYTVCWLNRCAVQLCPFWCSGQVSDCPGHLTIIQLLVDLNKHHLAINSFKKYHPAISNLNKYHLAIDSFKRYHSAINSFIKAYQETGLKMVAIDNQLYLMLYMILSGIRKYYQASYIASNIIAYHFQTVFLIASNIIRMLIVYKHII